MVQKNIVNDLVVFKYGETNYIRLGTDNFGDVLYAIYGKFSVTWTSCTQAFGSKLWIF